MCTGRELITSKPPPRDYNKIPQNLGELLKYIFGNKNPTMCEVCYFLICIFNQNIIMSFH